MDTELVKLAAVLRQIAHDAGCALLMRRHRDDLARHCRDQYNRIHARIAVLDADVAALFGPLPDGASLGQIRIVARALAAYLREQAREERRRTRAGCLAFVWPGCSLNFDLC